MSISVDVAEPEVIVKLLSQSAEINVMALNIEGYADYIFTDSSGKLVQIEREQVSTILSRTTQIEDEIRRHEHEPGTMILLSEGLVVPEAFGCLVQRIAGRTLIDEFVSKTRYEALIAWFWQIQEHGVELIQTLSPKASAIAISSIYHNAQKLDEEHKTFRRHYKPIVGWHPNRYIVSLMGLAEAELGEKRATELIEKFGTFYRVMTASEDELMPILKYAATKKLLKAIGRM